MALRVSSITETDTSSKSDSKSKEHSQSQSRSDSQSTTKKLLDSDLMNQILGGLVRNMTDEEINRFAENLLRPQLNAALEESRQNYETTKLSKEQELENLAASLTRAIDEQNTAYSKSAANVETAALSRGMGRSSYTLQTLANQGDALAKAVRQLTDENTRQERADSAADHAGGAAEQPDAGTTEHGFRQPAGGEGAGTERKPAQGMEQQLPDGDFCGDGTADDGQPADQRHDRHDGRTAHRGVEPLDERHLYQQGRRQIQNSTVRTR